MTRVFCASIVVSLAGLAHADTLRLSSSPFASGGGGEFTAAIITGNAGLTGDAPTSLSADSFQTFCLEHSENFRPGDVYNYSISTAAMLGGGGAEGGMDPLDSRTAYLYTRFRQGVLAGFDYGAGRQSAAGALQDAIWFIEQEGGANNFFVALADAAVAPGGEWFGLGLGDVRVLNLSNEEFPHAQDQLTLVSRVPAPSGAAVLLGVGVIASRRRRR